MLRNQNFGFRTDIWSLGVLSFFLFAGKFPFESESDPILRDKILYEVPDWNLLHKRGISKNIILMIRKMLKKNSLNRITINNLLKMKVFKIFTEKCSKGNLIKKESEKEYEEFIKFPDLKYRLKLNELEKSILRFYSHHLLEKNEIEKIREKFDELDINNNGLISYRELKKVFEKFNMTQSLKEVFEIIDTDQNRNISYNEYLDVMLDRKKLQIDNNIKKCFDALDTNSNGRLSFNELHVIMDTKNGMKNFKEIFWQYSKGKNYVKLIRYNIRNFIK